MNKHITTNIIIGVVSILVGFGIGTQYSSLTNANNNLQSSQFGNRMMQRNGTGQFNQQNGSGTRNTMRGGFRPVFGEVISADDTSLTVKMSDGSTKIVILTDKTVASTQKEAAIKDIKTGEKISVIGTEGTDGTYTAQSIQINPVMRAGMMPSGSPQKQN
ncbi:MAG: hypothetical protein U0525_03435 [Patescibacteria group bacterium]